MGYFWTDFYLFVSEVDFRPTTEQILSVLGLLRRYKVIHRDITEEFLGRGEIHQRILEEGLSDELTLLKKPLTIETRCNWDEKPSVATTLGQLSRNSDSEWYVQKSCTYPKPGIIEFPIAQTKEKHAEAIEKARTARAKIVRALKGHGIQEELIDAWLELQEYESRLALSHATTLGPFFRLELPLAPRFIDEFVTAFQSEDPDDVYIYKFKDRFWMERRLDTFYRVDLLLTLFVIAQFKLGTTGDVVSDYLPHYFRFNYKRLIKKLERVLGQKVDIYVL